MHNQKPFRIVHLSDLHLTKRDGSSRTQANIFQPLYGMNDTFREIMNKRIVRDSHFVIVTGDVTDRGDIEAWEVFWKTVKKSGFSSRILVVPGNHDLCCLGARMPFKRKAYREKDLEKAADGLKLGHQPTTFPAVCTPDERVVVLGINSNNLGNFSVLDNALGALDYYQLKALASKLHVYLHVPVKIIALHHSPNIPGRETARKRGLRPYSKLERAGHQIPQDQRHGLILLSVAARVRLLVHGHLHMIEDRRLSGIRIVGSPATTEPVRENTRQYQLFTYTVQKDGSRVRTELHTITL